MKRFPLHLVLLGLCAVLACGPAFGATPPRPKILGISHAAFYVSDMDKALQFYEGFLGYQSPFSIPRKNGGRLVWIKINDEQTIELFPGDEVSATAPRMYHVALRVDDAEAMRQYLKAKGVEVPDHTPVGKIGNANYFIKDPSGNTIEIVQYMPDSWTVKNKGKFLPASRVSVRMRHVGIMVSNLEPELKFLEDVLGFKEFWRGSSNGKQLSWVNARVPDGEDYLELMLYKQYPTPDRVHTLQHICLEVPDVAKVAAELTARPHPAGSKPPTPMKAGVNGRRQVNYYDPDGTRVEIMEPTTFDGKPRPSSHAPAPIGEPRS